MDPKRPFESVNVDKAETLEETRQETKMSEQHWEFEQKTKRFAEMKMVEKLDCLKTENHQMKHDVEKYQSYLKASFEKMIHVEATHKKMLLEFASLLEPFNPSLCESLSAFRSIIHSIPTDPKDMHECIGFAVEEIGFSGKIEATKENKITQEVSDLLKNTIIQLLDELQRYQTQFGLIALASPQGPGYLFTQASKGDDRLIESQKNTIVNYEHLIQSLIIQIKQLQARNFIGHWKIQEVCREIDTWGQKEAMKSNSISNDPSLKPFSPSHQKIESPVFNRTSPKSEIMGLTPIAIKSEEIEQSYSRSALYEYPLLLARIDEYEEKLKNLTIKDIEPTSHYQDLVLKYNRMLNNSKIREAQKDRELEDMSRKMKAYEDIHQKFQGELKAIKGKDQTYAEMSGCQNPLLKDTIDQVNKLVLERKETHAKTTELIDQMKAQRSTSQETMKKASKSEQDSHQDAVKSISEQLVKSRLDFEDLYQNFKSLLRLACQLRVYLQDRTTTSQQDLIDEIEKFERLDEKLSQPISDDVRGEAHIQISMLESKVAALETQINSLNEELTFQTDELDQTRLKCENYESKIEPFLLELNQRTQESLDVDLKISLMASQCELLKKEIESDRCSSQSLKSQNQVLKQDNDTLLARIEDLEKLHIQAKRQLGTMSATLRRLQDTLHYETELRINILDEIRTMELLRKSRDAYRNRYCHESKARKTAEVERAVLQQKVKELKTELTHTKGDNATQELDFYRRHFVCPICRHNKRDTLVSSCGHSYCHDCSNPHGSLTEGKSRRCPQCGVLYTKANLQQIL